MNKATTLKVASVERETEDAVTIHLKQPLLRRIQYAAGQYLTLEVDADGGKGCRAYSISSTPGLDKTLSITVKRIAGRPSFHRLVQGLSAGDSLTQLRRARRFIFSPQAVRTVVIWCCSPPAAESRRCSPSSSRRAFRARFACRLAGLLQPQYDR